METTSGDYLGTTIRIPTRHQTAAQRVGEKEANWVLLKAI